MNLNQLQEKALDMGIELDQHQLDQFFNYYQLLVEYNQKMNLTAITAFEEVVLKHFYDSLLINRVYKVHGHLADVGSGAGFPSIPLKIANPTLKVTIIEPLKKRCFFLTTLVEALKLQDVEIVNARAEEYVSNHRQAFDIVTARAVANLNVLSELCIPLVKVGGYFIAMKGDKGLQEDQDASKAITTLGCKKEMEDVFMMDEHKRVNLVYRKGKDTPKQYPRAYAKIKKMPL